MRIAALVEERNSALVAKMPTAFYISRVPFKPSKLEDWQVEDAKRLAALYRQRVPKGMPQSEFAERFGIGTQGMLWQYLRGRRPLNIKAAAGFARGLGVTIADISPKLAAQIDTMNAKPRLRELLEDCADLTDDQIAALRTVAAALRGKPPTGRSK